MNKIQISHWGVTPFNTTCSIQCTQMGHKCKYSLLVISIVLPSRPNPHQRQQEQGSQKLMGNFTNLE